jgi:hypothetical protein
MSSIHMYSVDSKISIGLKALFSIKTLDKTHFFLGPLELQKRVFLDIAHLCQHTAAVQVIISVKLKKLLKDLHQPMQY